MNGVPTTNRPSMYEHRARWRYKFARYLQPDYVLAVILTGLVLGCVAFAASYFPW